MPDDNDHHGSFEAGSPWTLFSEPKRLKAKREFETVAADLQRRLRERGRIDIGRDNLEHLADAITLQANGTDISDVQQGCGEATGAGSRAPLQRVAYYASVFLESQLFVVQERDEIYMQS